MKKAFYLMAAFLVALTACNKESQMENDKISAGDKVYVTFSIQALTTRSATGEQGGSDANPGVEVGLPKENTISSVDIVLRNANTYVCASVTSPKQDKKDESKWTATFNSSQLATNTNYEVYIYANCSAKQNIDAIEDEAIGNMTQDNKFWMTNAYTPGIANFASFSTDPSTPTNLGEFYVERSMARFDYMPKGPYTLADGVTVTLTQAALINQSKAFYLLRRVSNDGTNSGWTVGGAETKANYVVDTDYAVKQDGYTATQASNFDYHMTTPAKWVWKSIASKDLTQEDNWAGTDDGTTGSGQQHDAALNDYFVWQYCKENTIPEKTEKETQTNGLSTGIVFKGELTGTLVTEAAGKTIYVFDNVMYGTWDKVVAAANQANASEALKFAVEVCNNNGTAKDAATLAAAGFTGFSAEKVNNVNKYYTYYYYWNRHNDNGKNQDMGKMEFAVVRNNVYKICVDNIAKYGHPKPGGTDPDPDPVDPNDPDEKAEYYFSVTAKVLPWVVRVNHVEF